MLLRSDRPLAPRTVDLSYVLSVIAGPEPAQGASSSVGPCPPGTTARTVCLSRSWCDGPLSLQLSDAERVVLDDISATARRLATAITWAALLALTALVLLMMR